MTRAPISVGPLTLGTGAFAVIAGPCSIESESQFLETALVARTHGAALLRGGAYKLRTDPKSFQGLGTEALAIIRRTRHHLNMPVVSEITDPRQLESMLEDVDVLQVGTRNMYNYALLKEIGQTRKPVLLKRGFSALIDEWLKAADYIVNGGNENVILCERGIRTFETTLRNTLDLGAVAYIKKHTSFPVIVDPSHGAGRAELVEPLALAAAAAGADGLLIEIHPRPAEALSDAHQALNPADFAHLMTRLRRLLMALDRPLLTLPRGSDELAVAGPRSL